MNTTTKTVLILVLALGGCGSVDVAAPDVVKAQEGAAGSLGVPETDAGASGTSGAAGTSGASGTSGTAGTSGASGTSGTAGTSGASGTSGTAGTSGASGTSGALQANGSSCVSSGQCASGICCANGSETKCSTDDRCSFLPVCNTVSDCLPVGSPLGVQTGTVMCAPFAAEGPQGYCRYSANANTVTGMASICPSNKHVTGSNGTYSCAEGGPETPGWTGCPAVSNAPGFVCEDVSGCPGGAGCIAL